MSGRIMLLALAASLGIQHPLAAQRPRIGLGIGGGAVLGSQLLDHDFLAEVDGRVFRLIQQVDLEDVAVFSAHGEWYLTRHLALRGHAAWGDGRMQVHTRGETDGLVSYALFESDPGSVRVAALDASVSVWPWAPKSVGFAPFFTVGVGTYTYDFHTPDPFGLLQASGRRTERALIFGIGADMSVWRSVMLRMEAVNHRADSPLEPRDFDLELAPGTTRKLNESISNVRLTIGANVYIPFTNGGPGEDE